ncbi:MAG: hypothetical protein MK101_10830 [Phycisphaerales bacterium]|nr:hypothetical protein [Phycisphaerales bacterium]
MRPTTTLAFIAATACASALTAAPKVNLFQEFTATWCGYCPDVAEGLHTVLENNPETTTGLMIHGGDSYTTSLGDQLINFYSLSGYPTVWLNGTWSQVGSYGSPSANANALQGMLNNASSTTDVTIDVIGEEAGTNQYNLDITVGVESGGQTRNIKLYVTQVYNQENWPESNEIQFNTLRQSAPTQTFTLSPGQTYGFNHTFTLSGESTNTQHVNYVVWAQLNASSGPAMIYQSAEHKHGEAPPANVTVGPTGDFSTIQAALDEVGSGSTVTVAPGTYNEMIDFNGRSIDLLAASSDPSATVIDAQAQGRVVTMMGGSPTIDGFTIRGGHASSGSAMITNGTPMIKNCIIRDNDATGYYVIISAGNPTIADNVFCNNSPNNIGGAWTDGGGNSFDQDCGDEPCDGDYNGDGTVNVDDILTVIAGFGSMYTVDDILVTLANFGSGC